MYIVRRWMILYEIVCVEELSLCLWSRYCASLCIYIVYNYTLIKMPRKSKITYLLVLLLFTCLMSCFITLLFIRSFPDYW